jgi:hypothetical protein
MLQPRRATPLKKIKFSMAVSVLSALIVLPVIHSVNHSAVKTTGMHPTLRADGDPLPPPNPKPMPPGVIS